MERHSDFITTLMDGMGRVIVGQQHLVEAMLVGMLTDGHIL